MAGAAGVDGAHPAAAVSAAGAAAVAEGAVMSDLTVSSDPAASPAPPLPEFYLSAPPYSINAPPVFDAGLSQAIFADPRFREAQDHAEKAVALLRAVMLDIGIGAGITLHADGARLVID